MLHAEARLIADLDQLKGDSHARFAPILCVDVEHLWMTSDEQHTTFANGADPAGDDCSGSSTAAEAPALPA